ncbi:MAG TPA: hypothetical protein VFF67_09025 [Thermoplasmata archaeon]|nr:hypothetical protein [Thermoplasmata archaeon]
MITGFVAAPTFIPFRNASTFNGQFAEWFTFLAVSGGAVSILEVLAGRALLRWKGWTWTAALGVALSPVALNGVLAALWPGFVAFLVVVGVAYGLVILLLLLGRGSSRSVELQRSGY